VSQIIPREGSLVLYKLQPTLVQRAGEKLSLLLPDGETAHVRPKDVALLHPGPLARLDDLKPPPGDPATAWEILAGERTTLPELAELAFGVYSPASAWATWQLVADGLYFRGAPDDVVANTAAEVERLQAQRAAEQAEKQAWAEFVRRAHEKALAAGDNRYVRDVAALALGQATGSRVLRALGREETPESAHQWLLDVAAWDETINPYPARFKLNLTPPTAGAGDLAETGPAEQLGRVDLTALAAYAIDDASTETPDDAVSYGPRPGAPGAEPLLWVHVSDPAAAITPDSPLDLEARDRAASLHLPEGVTPMLPPEATPLFGLGLAETSPALSFGLRIGADGAPEIAELLPSWVRVARLTYEDADALIEAEPLKTAYAVAAAYEARRARQGRVAIDLPEAMVRVEGGEVSIRPVNTTRSRLLVENAMIMTGEATARYALEHAIAMPFATQEGPDEPIPAAASESLSGMYGLRRLMRRSQYRIAAAPHAGLGLDAYVQATSPMRRYLDLVVHQQLRAHLAAQAGFGGGPLAEQEMLTRVGAVEAMAGDIRQAESFSNRHWTLAYLLRHPRWRGEAVVVDRRRQTATVLLPDLALEAQVHLKEDLPLDSAIEVASRGVDLPRLETHWRIADG
jgi:exoribonuclease-2